MYGAMFVQKRDYSQFPADFWKKFMIMINIPVMHCHALLNL